jgi:alginate O-acetyltransferase complex protein AlgI
VESFLDKHSANGNGLATTVVFTARTALSVAILVLSVALLVGATNNAFIYTRF